MTGTGGDVQQAATAATGLKILFFLRAINFDRCFENLLRGMLQRGHEVHVALERERSGLREDATALFDSMSVQYNRRFTYEQLPRRTDTWLAPATALRYCIDYLRYLEPQFEHAELLRARARVRAARLFRVLLFIPPFRWRFGRRFVGWLLRRIEAAMPIPRDLKALVETRAPDVVLVSPLVELGSSQGDYIRVAKAAGIPTVLPVASWDNLTSKGIIRDIPTFTVVWNGSQVEEAVSLHGIPRERVFAVGAHTWDHWFNWEPATAREEFAAKVGIDPDRPLILYVGSSNFITSDETGFIQDWLSRLRAHPRLTDAGVVLRPHPQNLAGWKNADLEEPGKTVAWPREGAHPTAIQNKHDYFESLYHSRAVVGINTSALIEAAIVRRPVLTLVSDYSSTQEGTVHFAYLAGKDSPGMLIVGRSWDEHIEQLADAVADTDLHAPRLEAFLSHFVRPRGLDVAAAPLAVDCIERAASVPVTKPRTGMLLRPILWLLTPLVPIVLTVLHPVRTYRTVMKHLRRFWKRARKRAKIMRRAVTRRRKIARRKVGMKTRRADGRAEKRADAAKKVAAEAKRSTAQAKKPDAKRTKHAAEANETVAEVAAAGASADAPVLTPEQSKDSNRRLREQERERLRGELAQAKAAKEARARAKVAKAQGTDAAPLTTPEGSGSDPDEIATEAGTPDDGAKPGKQPRRWTRAR